MKSFLFRKHCIYRHLKPNLFNSVHTMKFSKTLPLDDCVKHAVSNDRIPYHVFGCMYNCSLSLTCFLQQRLTLNVVCRILSRYLSQLPRVWQLVNMKIFLCQSKITERFEMFIVILYFTTFQQLLMLLTNEMCSIDWQTYKMSYAYFFIPHCEMS